MHVTTSVPHTSGGSFCATAALVTSITAFHDACILTALLHHQTSSITKKIKKRKKEEAPSNNNPQGLILKDEFRIPTSPKTKLPEIGSAAEARQSLRSHDDEQRRGL